MPAEWRTQTELLESFNNLRARTAELPHPLTWPTPVTLTFVDGTVEIPAEVTGEECLADIADSVSEADEIVPANNAEIRYCLNDYVNTLIHTIIERSKTRSTAELAEHAGRSTEFTELERFIVGLSTDVPYSIRHELLSVMASFGLPGMARRWMLAKIIRFHDLDSYIAYNLHDERLEYYDSHPARYVFPEIDLEETDRYQYENYLAVARRADTSLMVVALRSDIMHEFSSVCTYLYDRVRLTQADRRELDAAAMLTLWYTQATPSLRAHVVRACTEAYLPIGYKPMMDALRAAETTGLVHETLVDVVQIETKPKRVNKAEKYLKAQLEAYFNKSLSIETVREFLDQGELIAHLPSEEALPGRTCSLCGSTRALSTISNRRYCGVCVTIARGSNDLLSSTVTAVRAVNAKDINDRLLTLQRHMMEQGRLQYSTQVPCEHAEPLAMGIELELERINGYAYPKFGRDIHLAALPGIIKADGSLHDGCEFVTAPLPSKKLQEVIAKYCVLAKEKGFAAKNTCGMHIHINRKGFDGEAHIVRFSHIFNTLMPDPFLKAYIGGKRYTDQVKRSGGYAAQRKMTVENMCANDEGNVYFGQRHSAVNMTNKNTIEVRFFAPTTNPGKAKANVQYVEAAREYTRVVKDIEWTGFVAFVIRNIAKFPDLADRMTRFKAIANEVSNLDRNLQLSETVESVI